MRYLIVKIQIAVECFSADGVYRVTFWKTPIFFDRGHMLPPLIEATPIMIVTNPLCLPKTADQTSYMRAYVKAHTTERAWTHA